MRLRYYSWPKLLLAAGMIVWTYVFVSIVERTSDRVDVDQHPLLAERLQNDVWVSLRKGPNATKVYTRNSPLLFITGTARSGLNLLRILLDAHPAIRCSPESGMPMNVIGYRAFIQNHPVEVERLASAGISADIIDVAFADFLLQVFARQGDPSELICVAEHSTAENYGYLDIFYPNAKFIHIIRDGRAVASSIYSRKIDLRMDGYSTDDYLQNLDVWNKVEKGLLKHCVYAGEDKCMPLYYEMLVREPEKWLRSIFQFLNVTWDSRVLRHDKLIEANLIKRSKYEENKEGLAKPIDSSYSYSWIKKVSANKLDGAFKRAPTLSLLGYDRTKISSSHIDYSELEQHLSVWAFS